MALYQRFVTARTTAPDVAQLVAALHAIDPTIGGTTPEGNVYTLKKDTPWTQAQIDAAQTALDTAPALTPQRQAQNEIDAWGIWQRALVLALIDQLNVIRANLPAPLPPITPAQALNAIRNKAGQL